MPARELAKLIEAIEAFNASYADDPGPYGDIIAQLGPIGEQLSGIDPEAGYESPGMDAAREGAQEAAAEEAARPPRESVLPDIDLGEAELEAGEDDVIDDEEELADEDDEDDQPDGSRRRRRTTR